MGIIKKTNVGSKVTPIKNIPVKKVVKEVIKKDVYSIYGADEEGDINDMIELVGDFIEDTENLVLELNNLTVFEVEVNELPHCCGIYELGKILFKPFKDEVKFFNALAICKKGKTLMINTINTGQSAELSKVLAKCSNWTLVKTFINSGSRNEIKIWMSNNN